VVSQAIRIAVIDMVMSTKGGKMNERHSITEAYRSLPRLIREVEHGKTVKLTRRGEPVAVLVGYQAFERIIAGRRNFIDAYEEFAKTVDLSDLAIDPAELLEGARDPGPGRDVQL